MGLIHSLGVIAEVHPGSLGDRLGLFPGDRLVSINGTPPSDWIDYRFLITGEALEIVVKGRDGTRKLLKVAKDHDEDLGIVFAEDLFDGIKYCHNACKFCFLKQMPAGMRKSLYIPDDDYRLSFLHGNFITLTNLKEEDFSRIFAQRLSPLYVSVHATDSAVRRRLMLNRKSLRIMEDLQRLVDGGIRVHCQLVLCPGINDGPVLERSLTDLAALGSGILSIAAVPVGLTRHRAGQPGLRTYTAEEADEVLDTVARRQAEFLEQRGSRLVFAADELYVLAGREVPPSAAYEGYPQLENGIGLIRVFSDGFRAAWRKMKRAGSRSARKVTVVTGRSARGMLSGLVDEMGPIGRGIDVSSAENRFFGSTVTVAGLLTGRDILDHLEGNRRAGRDLGEEILLPEVVVRDGDGRFLDDMHSEQISERLGMPVRIVPTDGASFLAALTGRDD